MDLTWRMDYATRPVVAEQRNLRSPSTRVASALANTSGDPAAASPRDQQAVIAPVSVPATVPAA